MQLKVTLPGEYTLFNLTDAATFLACLATSRSVKTEGWGKDQKHIETKDKPILEIVSDDYGIEPLPAPLVELQKSLRSSEEAWMRYYTEANKAKAEVKTLTEELERIRGAVGSPDKPTTKAAAED